jgi:hypothetical protein
VRREPCQPELDAEGNEIPFVRREPSQPALDAEGNEIPFVRGGTRGDQNNRGPR